MYRHLVLALEGPMMSFGDVAIDNLSVTGSYPTASQLTGMIANALGYRRTDRDLLQELQDRLVFASAVVQEPAGGWSSQDFQTVQLGARDMMWTTNGTPEGRDGGLHTFDSPHLRYRDYFADMRVAVALRLRPEQPSPTLDDIVSALQKPRRPLFIGRKHCLPSGRIFRGFRHADTALEALSLHAADGGVPHDAHEELANLLYDRVLASSTDVRACWPAGEGGHVALMENSFRTTDQRNWLTGLHGGSRLLHEGRMTISA